METLRFIRRLLIGVGLGCAGGVASALDLATLESRVQWDAPAFRTAIVCDQPGRPTVALPEVITQKVQESFKQHALVYYHGAISYSESVEHKSLESYSLPTNYYGTVYRYAFPGQKTRILFAYAQIESEISRRVTFWIYDTSNGQASATSVAQSTQWLDSPDNEDGTSTNHLGDPYVTFLDIDRDGVPEVVSYEAGHAGTDDHRLYYHYYRVNADLGLQRVLTRPAFVYVYEPHRNLGGSLRSQLVALPNQRIRIEVYAWELPPVKDGTLVAAYTCERRGSNRPFVLIERRIETIPELDHWKRGIGFFDHALGSLESRTAPVLPSPVLPRKPAVTEGR